MQRPKRATDNPRENENSEHPARASKMLRKLLDVMQGRRQMTAEEYIRLVEAVRTSDED